MLRQEWLPTRTVDAPPSHQRGVQEEQECRGVAFSCRGEEASQGILIEHTLHQIINIHFIFDDKYLFIFDNKHLFHL